MPNIDTELAGLQALAREYDETAARLESLKAAKYSKVLRAYEAGASMETCARVSGISKTAIGRWMDQNGHRRREAHRPKGSASR